ncbi:MAG: tetratricopeptide repeat protein [Gammaproteobacteria bacterium]
MARALPLLLVLAALLSACAGGGTRAPIEARDAESPAVEQTPDVEAPEVDVLTSPIELPEPGVAEALGEDADPGDDSAVSAERLALAAPAQPRNPAAQSLLEAATAAALRGEWDRAQAALERAVRVAPNDAGLWRQLAFTHYRQGDHAQAMEIARRALRVAPEGAAAAESWRLIGDIEAAQGNTAAAAAARARAERP